MKKNHVLALIFAYYLSRFDKKALHNLNLDTMQEAFNLAEKKLNVNPNTVKNMRDEFDPIHPNPRKGWYQRELRPSRLDIVNMYSDFSEDALTDIVIDTLNMDKKSRQHHINTVRKVNRKTPAFTTRGITGKKAEELFIDFFNEGKILGLKGELIDTREHGSGYDFKLANDPNYVFEVKGLLDEKGGINFTDKEWATAKKLQEKYILVVIKNIEVKPLLEIFVDPYKKLNPKKYLYETIAVNWIVDNI